MTTGDQDPGGYHRGRPRRCGGARRRIRRQPHDGGARRRRSSSRSTNGTAGRCSCSGPGPRRTSSSPRSSSACSRWPRSGWASGRPCWPRSCSAPALGSIYPRRAVRARPDARRAADGAVPARLRLLGQRAAGRAELGHRRHRLVRGQQRQRRARPEHADQPAASRSAWSSSSWSRSAIAFFGHNLVQAFERYAFPVLAVIFVIAAIDRS